MVFAAPSSDPSAGPLQALAAQRVLVKAGPSGTALRALGVREGNYDALVLTEPALVERVHREYLEAGADLIETNTFNAQSLSLRPFGLAHAVYDLNVAAARLSRRMADHFSELDPARPRFAVGNMGPSELGLRRIPPGREREQAFEQVRAAYAEQARALIEGGVDALLLETVYDEQTAQACVLGIRAAESEMGRSLPLMLSVTPGRDGRMPSGREVSEVLGDFASTRPWCFGTNCGFGPESVTVPLEALAERAACLVSVYPNAGLPDAAGRYSAADAVVARGADSAARGFANIVGGCCGTTPREVRALARAVAGIAPREYARKP